MMTVDHAVKDSTRPKPAAWLAMGGVCGLAWASGLRGVMAVFAGPGSTFSWSGTFGWIVVPGVAVGMLLAWADHLRRTGGPRRDRLRHRLALSPLLFSAVLFSDPAGLAQLLKDGIGGGALAIPLFGIMGGYALSTRGLLWARVLCRVVLLAPVPAGLAALLLTGAAIGPRDAWMFLSIYSFVLVLGIACAIPHRPR
ncbi:hypothetical protein IL992_36785 [Microbispora sp. NEAU-D428]|uniref:hypothetical protein n=1 Tax=Microbispora sitophila TaxID=2771537 RepID=UPI001866E229|nr:hypothetical protein [Microbispora sitophila]MBE3014694.1 hypothetical protein [Microbispora sitophila]